MSRRSKKRSTDERRGARLSSRRSAAGGPSDDLLLWLLKAAVAALIVGRLLVPTEASAEGATLWMVQLWFGVGLLWVWRSVRERDFHVRCDWLDLALLGLIAGHVLSALAVVADGGRSNPASGAFLTTGWLHLNHEPFNFFARIPNSNFFLLNI